MPQGKGTYGSKVGRPPKKKAEGYMGGGKVEGYNREVVADAVRRRRAHTRKRKEAIKELEKKWRKEASAKAVKKSVENAKKQMKTRKENEKFLKEFGYEPEQFNEGGMVMEPEEYKKGGKVKKKKGKWYPGKALDWMTGAKKRRLKKAYKKEGMSPEKARAKAKEEAPKSGRVRRGAITAADTKTEKGGEFVKYKKKSGAAKSFREAFAAARKAGKKTFTWDGRSYAAVTKEDVAKKKADKAASDSKLKAAEDAATKKAMAPAPKPKVDDKPGPYGPDYFKEELKKMSEGGEVKSSNPYGWPSTDARGRKD